MWKSFNIYKYPSFAFNAVSLSLKLQSLLRRSRVARRKAPFSTMGLKSFVEVHPDSHFPIQNLPYGVFRPAPGSDPRPGVAIGDYVLDLLAIDSAGLFDGPILQRSDCFHQVESPNTIK